MHVACTTEPEAMSEPPTSLQPAIPPSPPASVRDAARLARYVPGIAGGATASPHALFEHLAAVRAAIGSYLPRQLRSQALAELPAGPWLRWVEGSLLFADLSGSTALAERLGTLGREGTEMVTDCLNQIFTLLIQTIHDYGGDLVAFGGDALLVFFGDDRHPRTAARAALALQDAMHGYVQEVPGIGSFPMHLHIGVESGRVAFVSAGGAEALHYSVLGAAVNRVAVAEGHAPSEQVVVGPQAWATLAAFAAGAEVAPGFYRIDSMRAPARPHLPLPAEPAPAGLPEQVIPQLLDELDRISPYMAPALFQRILAEPERPRIEAELRPVTVLFAQVLGLEALAEALPPAQAAQVVQAYVGAMQAIIDRFGGLLNKLDVADEGVKLVVIFGAPTAYEDHAERAARAALEMQSQLELVNQQIDRLLTQNQEPRTENQPALGEVLPRFSVLGSQFSLSQRIGLNLGTAFAGNVGSDARKEYTVMGDAVNVAARVMGKAAWGQVWCSEAAARVIAARMACDDRGYLALKGKALPVQLFELTGLRDAPAAALDGAEGPLVGRASELAWLVGQLDAARGGAGRAVRVTGDAGIGKSRLVAELLAAASAAGVAILQATCYSYSTSIPYAAWAECLKAICGTVAGDTDALRERKLLRRLAALGPGMAEWLPLLGDLLRLDVPENWLTRGLEPQLRQARRFELLEQLLHQQASRGPLLVLFEDLHWADPISLDLWRRVAAGLAGRPILLLGAHRPAAIFADEPDGAQLLELKELSGEQSADLAAALAGDTQLPEPLVRQLVERSAGNPLFLSELLHAVRERWNAPTFQRANVLTLDDLPDSLNGLLLARIDRLDAHSRTVLRVASVIGQRIMFDVLEPIQPYDQETLLRELGLLDTANLTELERIEPVRVHAFRHALIQEVAYQSMLYARRRELHGRIGAYLEQRHAGDLDDYYGLLAHHYRLSDQREKAIEYLWRAGQAAQAVYANDEAIQHFVWALDALAGDDADPRAWQVRDALGDVYATVGRYDDALAQHAAILAAPGVPPDTARRAHRKRGNVLEKQGRYAAALAELDQAMAIVRSGAQGIAPLAIAMINADIGLVRQRLGEYDLAIAACEQGLLAVHDDPNSFDDEKTEARLHSTLGAIFGMRGDYARAHEHFQHSLQLRAAVDDLPGMVVSHNNLGYLWQLQGQYTRAIEHYRVAEELAQKINLRYALIFATLNRAYALISLAEYAEAQACSEQALDLSRQLNDQQNIAQSLHTQGIICYHTGDYAASLRAYEQAVAIFRTLGSGYQEGNAHMHLALTLCALGDYAPARELAQAALARAEALSAQRLIAEALNVLAEIALGTGELAQALDYAQQAHERADAIGSRRDLAIAQRLLGARYAAGAQPFAAWFEQSIAELTTIGDRFELGRTWAVYGLALARSGNIARADAYLKQAQETFISIGAHGELQHLSQIAERSS